MTTKFSEDFIILYKQFLVGDSVKELQMTDNQVKAYHRFLVPIFYY